MSTGEMTRTTTVFDDNDTTTLPSSSETFTISERTVLGSGDTTGTMPASSDTNTALNSSDKATCEMTTALGNEAISRSVGESSLPTRCRRRRNTVDEKRRMRKKRKRAKRAMAKNCGEKKLQQIIRKQRSEMRDREQQVVHFKSMARSYWERWHWELQKRKEAVVLQRSTSRRLMPEVAMSHFHEIDPNNLANPAGTTSPDSLYFARGSFSVVKLQEYRGFRVAVKELLPRTNLDDLKHEATMLQKLCHPYLPYLFGVCTRVKPYRLVLQFHGISECALTLADAVAQRKPLITNGKSCTLLCVQIMEALRYLHEDEEILHNDLKCNNVLLAEADSGDGDSWLHIVITDFGKASTISEERRLRLSFVDESEYLRKYPHIAPEVIEGEHPYSTKSDIFAAGGILWRLIDNRCFLSVSREQQNSLKRIATTCRSAKFYQRPTAAKVISDLQQTGGNQ